MQPVYGRHGGDVCCAYVPYQHHRGGPRTSAPRRCGRSRSRPSSSCGTVAHEPQFWVERQLEPGSMLFCNNHTAFHMRTEFRD